MTQRGIPDFVGNRRLNRFRASWGVLPRGHGSDRHVSRHEVWCWESLDMFTRRVAIARAPGLLGKVPHSRINSPRSYGVCRRSSHRRIRRGLLIFASQVPRKPRCRRGPSDEQFGRVGPPFGDRGHVESSPSRETTRSHPSCPLAAHTASGCGSSPQPMVGTGERACADRHARGQQHVAQALLGGAVCFAAQRDRRPRRRRHLRAGGALGLGALCARAASRRACRAVS